MEASGNATNLPPASNPPVAKVLRLRRQTPPILEQYVIRGNILEQNADVEFHCADGVVKAHKVILSLVSNFFSNLFRFQAEEAVVMVPDIKIAVMKAIVNLCYKRDVTLDSVIVPQVAQWLSDFGLRLQDFTFGTREGFAQQKTPERVQPLKKVIKSEPIIPPSPASVTDEPMHETTQEPEPHVDENGGREIETPASQCPTFWLDLESFGQPPVSSSPQIPFTPAEAAPRPQNPLGNVKKLIPVVPATPRKTRNQQDVLAQKIWTENVLRTPSNLPPVLKPEARTFAITHHHPPGTPAPRILIGSDQKADKTCQVCKCAFSNETQWKWHTERHLSNGLFKCTGCRRTFNSSRNVYQHEMSVHKAGGLPLAGSSASSTIQSEDAEEEEEEPATNENIKRKNLLTFHRSKYLHRRHQRVTPLKLKALAGHANLAGKRGRRPKWSISKAPSPDIAPTPRKDTTKIRWVYICKKCKHSSDSSIKAFAHFVQCSPNSDQKYEDTVDKCRQGHYGDYECPICTRQYSTMQGFVVHCMHTHKDYRKSFSHIINDDKLLCIHCGGTFPNPQEFHDHLNQDTYLCEQPNKLVAKPVKKFQGKIASRDQVKLLQPRIYLSDVLEKMPSEETIEPQNDSNMPAPPTPDSASKRIKRKLSQTETSDDPRKELFKKMLSTNPKSARLQNRLAAVTSEEKVHQPIEVTCAICGISVSDLKLHLDTDHGDLDMDIEIVEDSIFRCNYCSISFASCDLLAHHRSCEANKVSDPVQVPSHVGVSPVDQIGTNDLMAIETIKNALQCPVCKLEAKKLNVISECLRNHGIFRCSLCFNTYSSKEEQTKHMKSCHMNSNSQIICPICQSVRSNIGQVTSHVYASHWSHFFKKYDKSGKALPRPENDFSLEISPAKTSLEGSDE